MAFTDIKNSFVAGELSPAVYGRTDLAKYKLGATTYRNFFVGYRGGAYSRAGLAYCDMCKQPGTAAPPRPIPFQFNNQQGFILEFGDNYMRVVSNGAYVLEGAQNVVAITQGNPGFIEITSHGFSDGDWVFGSSIGGMTFLNGLTWIVQNATTDTFTLTDLFGNQVNTLTYPAYTSGGTFARLYTLATPYAAVDLPWLKFTQSADTMTLDCVNPNTLTGIPAVEYPPYNLVRNGAANWSLTQITYASAISAPTGIAGSVTSSTTLDTFYSYVVTAVDGNGNESVASSAVTLENNDIAINAGSNTVTWNPVAGAVYYNIYKATPSYNAPVAIGVNYGYAGEAFGTAFTDTNITADFTRVPPVHQNPFARGQIIDIVPTAGGSGYTQSTIGYSITTSTGSNFAGSPIALNGAFVGFLNENNGENYANTDTITITGSGAVAASGWIDFTGNPSNGLTIGLNGVTWTFVTSGATGSQTNIQGSVLATIGQLVTDLTASANAGISVANYGLQEGPVSGHTRLNITYKTGGAAGNSYALTASLKSGSTLTGGVDASGSSATAVLVIGPQSGTYPSVPSYLFQRAVQANTLNAPDDYFMSKPGQYLNMDSSIPINDGDAIIGNPWAQQINGIEFIQPMLNAAVIFTGSGTWLLSGGGGVGTPFTPTSEQATPQEYNGISSTVPPIPVNSEILYVQSLGGVVRDLSYNYFTQRCTSVDVTVLSSHLFENHQVIQWTYAQEPFKVFWTVRDDGYALSLTFIKEQEVQGWSRHDTNGLFVGVASVIEPPVNAVYWIVKRFVNGAWHYYSERFDNRLWGSNVEDCFCVDAGLSYPQPTPNATLTPSGTSGTITLIASAGVFSNANVGQVVRVGGGIMDVTAFVSSTVLTAVVRQNQNITATVPNDPNNTPVPQMAGNWTITQPTVRVTGLNHLTGLQVAILADGGVVPNQAVKAFDDGTVGVTLPAPASAITVGLPFLPQLQTMYLDPPSQETTQSRRKGINAVDLRVENTRGISVGTNQPDMATQPNGAIPVWSNMTELKMRNQNIVLGQPIPLETGDFYLSPQGGWSEKSQVAIQQPYPLPANISAIITYFNTGDTAG